MSLKLGWEIGEWAGKVLLQGIRKNIPEVVKKTLAGGKFALLPESSAAKMIRSKGLVGDSAELLDTGSKIAETLWWAPALARGGGMLTDGLQIWSVVKSADGNEWTASENIDQLAMKGTSAALMAASIKVKNPLLKLGLRLSSLGVGLANDTVESMIDSSRGKATWLDKLGFLGNYGTVFTDQYGFDQGGYSPIREHYEKKDRESGYFNYGKARFYQEKEREIPHLLQILG
ncbi:MAG: hypothetical protein EBR67_03700 [Proteobacteria bacterium]|nr:hypothetical protein [Pseudomonadota bacterium]